MKNYLLVFVLALQFSTAESQAFLPEKDGKVVFEEIDTIPGTTESELYYRSKTWTINEFKDAQKVIQLDDKDAGQLIGKGDFTYVYKVLTARADWTCNFTFQIDCRDNKARIKIYDISTMAGGEATAEYLNKHKSKQHIKNINENMQAILATFKKTISTKPDNFQ